MRTQVTRPDAPGLVRSTLGPGLFAGLVGTTAMTLTTMLEQRLRPRLDHPVDYDASNAPVTAAALVLGVQPHTKAQRRLLFLLVHWGYGSLMGTGQVLLRRKLPGSEATAVYLVGVQGMAFVLLPLLGGTPPPWRWRPDMFVTSLGQHAVYAVATGVAAGSGRRRE